MCEQLAEASDSGTTGTGDLEALPCITGYPGEV